MHIETYKLNEPITLERLRQNKNQLEAAMEMCDYSIGKKYINLALELVDDLITAKMSEFGWIATSTGGRLRIATWCRIRGTPASRRIRGRRPNAPTLLFPRSF